MGTKKQKSETVAGKSTGPAALDLDVKFIDEIPKMSKAASSRYDGIIVSLAEKVGKPALLATGLPENVATNRRSGLKRAAERFEGTYKFPTRKEEGGTYSIYGICESDKG